jgi:hypothetical protein
MASGNGWSTAVAPPQLRPCSPPKAPHPPLSHAMLGLRVLVAQRRPSQVGRPHPPAAPRDCRLLALPAGPPPCRSTSPGLPCHPPFLWLCPPGRPPRSATTPISRHSPSTLGTCRAGRRRGSSASFAQTCHHSWRRSRNRRPSSWWCLRLLPSPLPPTFPLRWPQPAHASGLPLSR